MLLHLPEVLDAETAKRIRDSLGSAAFVDGRLTSGDPGTTGKHNLQLPRGSALADTAGDAVLRALVAHAGFVRAVRPRAVIRPQFARYDVGMHYAPHVDRPLMMDGQRVRSDVSVTVFLCDASEYDGGELVLDTEAGERRLRGNTGDVVLYPSTYVHEVTPVTRGRRLVAVTWVQSSIRSAAERKLLHDLETATDAVSGGAEESPAVRTLRQCHDNLLRMWAD